MTSPTLTRTSPAPPVSDRFTLNPEATVAFLARIRRRWHDLPDLACPPGETWMAGPDWEPRETRDLAHLEALVPAAIEAAAITPPDGWDLRMLATDDEEDGWYQWQLGYCAAGDVPRTLGFAVTSECLENLALIGRDGAKGTPGVLHVLAEAVECANRLLDAYVEAAGRMVLPVMTDAASHSYGPPPGDRPDEHGMVPRDGR